MFRKRVLPIVLLLPLTLAACGGGGDASDDAAAPDTTASATADTASSDTSAAAATPDTTAAADTLPPFSAPERKFYETDAKARFVNLYTNGGKPSDVDVWWGNSPDFGEKATTLAFGTVTDYLPVKIDKDPLLVPADGSTEINVSFYLPGQTKFDAMLMQKSETLEKGLRLTFVLATDKPLPTMGGTPPAHSGATLQVGFDSQMGAVPAGKFLLVFNDLGLRSVDGGDFMTPSATGTCNTWSIANDLSTANLGTAYVLDPGAYDVTASDANTDCSVRTAPVHLDAAAGDVWLVFAHGTTKDDRALIASKLPAA